MTKSHLVPMSLAERIAFITVDGGHGDPWFELAEDPTNVEVIGSVIAGELEKYRPDVIISWEGNDESVLAHIVARELGVGRVTVDLDLGLLTLSATLPDGGRAALVGTTFTPNHPINSVATLLETKGQSLVAAAAITVSPALSAIAGGPPIIALG